MGVNRSDRAAGILNERLQHFWITLISETNPPCVSEQSHVWKDTLSSVLGVSTSGLKQPFKLYKLLQTDSLKCCWRWLPTPVKENIWNHFKVFQKNRKKHECGSGDADWASQTATVTAPRCTSSLFVYFLSGVNIYAWLQPSHLHMSHPANTIRARTNIPQLSGTQRRSQNSPSSQILTYFLA